MANRHNITLPLFSFELCSTTGRKDYSNLMFATQIQNKRRVYRIALNNNGRYVRGTTTQAENFSVSSDVHRIAMELQSIKGIYIQSFCSEQKCSTRVCYTVNCRAKLWSASLLNNEWTVEHKFSYLEPRNRTFFWYTVRKPRSP